MSESTISEPPILTKETIELPVELPVFTWESLEKQNNYPPDASLRVVKRKGTINDCIGWPIRDYEAYLGGLDEVMWECLSVEKHYFEQAKALKDDPDKQPEFQALWLKADKLHQDAKRCERMIEQIKRLPHVKWLEEMKKHDFYEPPKSKYPALKFLEKKLSCPRVDPILAQKIREDVKASPEKASSYYRKGIKHRTSLEWLGKSSEITYFPSDPEEFEEPFTPPQDVLQSNEIYMEVCRHISELRNLTRHMEYHIGNHIRTLTEQVKALKDDPNKQPEFQALWTLADKYHQQYDSINRQVHQILYHKLGLHRLVKTYANILEHEFEVPPPFPHVVSIKTPRGNCVVKQPSFIYCDSDE